jgi:rod shape-determining protein MreC
MTLDQRTGLVEPLRDGLALVVEPVQRLAALPQRIAIRLREDWAEREHLLAINRRLRADLRDLRLRQQKLEALELENQRLRRLVGAAEHLAPQRVEIAELIAVDLDPYRQVVLINRGSLQGVYEGQPVLDEAGVMGQVIEVAPTTALVILISDPSHAIPVQILRNGLRSVAAGTGSPDRLQLLYIPDSADVRVGDRVNTSGLGGRFPADYPVGIVTAVERRPGEPFAHITARPLARLDRSREVLLLWWERPEAAMAVEPAP